LQDCLSKQLFIEKHKVTGQNVDIYTFQMILQFVVKAFEEESSLLLPEVYNRYKLLLHKNDLNIVIDSDKENICIISVYQTTKVFLFWYITQ
jgi:hypothetical protein